MSLYGSPDLSKKEDYEFYKCKKCGTEYYSNWERCPQCKTPIGKGSISNRPLFYILIFIITVAVASIYNNLDIGAIKKTNNNANIKENINNESLTVSNNNRTVKPTENLTPVATPKTGIYKVYTTNQLLAPLETINHNDNNHYLFKLTSPETKTTTLTIFINKKENCNVKIPLGKYEISYAFGETWYGDDKLFGTSTQYRKYPNNYDFYYDIETPQYRGWYFDMQNTAIATQEIIFLNKEEF